MASVAITGQAESLGTASVVVTSQADSSEMVSLAVTRQAGCSETAMTGQAERSDKELILTRNESQ